MSRQVDPTFIEPVLERVTSRSIPNSVPDPGGLERSIRQVLDAYSQHEIAAYLRLMREQGVEPSEQIVANPEGAQDHWQATRSVLATANMDLDRIVVLHTVRQGERQYEQEPPPFFSLRRDEGRRFLNSLSSRATEVAEVRIPGEYPSADGTRFDGDLTIQFTFDPGSKRWVLTEFRMAGVPVGVPIRLPPL
ncbi:MAG: hypothetical protein KJZ65_05245 [Phycisphaerales bacterium]|nr:hypothetical protein [Phycisphaerales bacterium]